jgi:hypothetical protein
MRAAYAGTGATYTGSSGNHADHLTILRPWWQNCRTGLYLRTEQSVCHNIVDPRTLGNGAVPSEVVYAERGGELKMEGGDFAGNDVTALRLANNGSNVGDFHIMDCRFDTNSVRPKWLTMDWDYYGHNRVTFQQCKIDEGVTTYDLPLWHAKGAVKLVIEQCFHIRTGSIQLNQVDGGGGLFWTPHCVIRDSTISNLTSAPIAAEPYTVNHASSGTAPGGSSYPISYTFDGCNSTGSGSIIYDNGRYLLGTGWAAGYPLPTPP